MVAAGLVLVEGIVATIYGVAELLHLTSARLTMGLTTAAFFLAVGVGLAACSWGLSRIRSWARGPVLLAQLMALGLAWNFRDGDTWPVSVALAVPAVIVLAGILHPESLAALEDSDRSTDRR